MVIGSADASGSSTVPVFGLTFGTGTPPTGNAAHTGTDFGQIGILPPNITHLNTIGIVSLTPGTTYWFDMYYYNFSGAGTVVLENPFVLVIEF